MLKEHSSHLIAIIAVCTYLVYRFVYQRDKATLRYRRPERSSLWKVMQTFGDGMKFRASILKGAILDKSSRQMNSSNNKDSDSGDDDVCENLSDGDSSKKAATTKRGSSEELALSESFYDDLNPHALKESMRRPTGAWALALQDAEDQHVDSSELMTESFESNNKKGRDQETKDDKDTTDPVTTITEQDGREVAGEEQQPKKRGSVETKLKEWKKKRQRFAQDMPHTMEVFHQACFYVGAFYCTHIWSTSNRIVQTISDSGDTVFPLICLHSFFDPFQGFLNYVVYQRPRYLQIRRQRPELGRLVAVRKTLEFSYKKSNDNSNAYSSRHESSMVANGGASSRWSLSET